MGHPHGLEEKNLRLSEIIYPSAPAGKWHNQELIPDLSMLQPEENTEVYLLFLFLIQYENISLRLASITGTELSLSLFNKNNRLAQPFFLLRAVRSHS